MNTPDSLSFFSENAVAKELVETKVARNESGELIKIHSHIEAAYADALYQNVLSHKPRVVLEIGMAFGLASLAILTALKKLGQNGKLISIDPYQTLQWRRCGLQSVIRAGLQDHHELVEEFDYLALPRLLANGTRLDFAYLDGWHTFDYTLLDFWYIDKMLNTGGVAAFNDCIYPAVHKVIKFAQIHRRYKEIDAGLPPHVSRKLELKRYLKLQLSKLDQLQYQDRYFVKTAEFEMPPGRHDYVDF